MSAPFADILAAADTSHDAAAPQPGLGGGRPGSTRRLQARRDAAVPPEVSTVTAGHRMAFHWLRAGDGQFGLISCHVNGQPSALIVAAQVAEEGYALMPLFIALTPGMRVTDLDGDVIYGETP